MVLYRWSRFLIEPSLHAVILSGERRSRTESKDPTYDGSAARFAKLFHDTVAENVSTVVASQADLGCFDATAAFAALPLSMTGVEKINKVTHSERSEANTERSRRTPRR